MAPINEVSTIPLGASIDGDLEVSDSDIMAGWVTRLMRLRRCDKFVGCVDSSFHFWAGAGEMADGIEFVAQLEEYLE